MLKQQIDQDLKKAMLAGDKDKATVLRGLKSVILYAEVAEGVRDTGITNDQLIALLAKEAKKRQESADLYVQGGSPERAEKELAEKQIIEAYLPQQLSEQELAKIVDTAIRELEAADLQAMGKVIGLVKQRVGSQADGARVAQLVKTRLAQA